MLSLFRLVFKYLEVALEGDCTRGLIPANQTTTFNLCMSFLGFWWDKYEALSSSRYHRCCLLGQAEQPLHALKDVLGKGWQTGAFTHFHMNWQVSGAMLNSNAFLQDFKPNDFALDITFVPATGFLAFVPSHGPCAGRTPLPQCSDAKRLPLTASQANLQVLWSQLLVGYSKWAVCTPLVLLKSLLQSSRPQGALLASNPPLISFAPPAWIFMRWHVIWWYLVPRVMLMSCVLDLKCQFHFVVHNNLFLWQSIKNCTESWHACLQRCGRGSRRT